MNQKLRIMFIYCSIVVIMIAAIIPVSAKVIIEEVGASIFPSRFMPSEGDVSALVIPVEFVDFRFQEDPVDTLDEMFNGSGTTYAPSVKEYFDRASYGEMQFSAQIQSVIRLSNTRKSYNDSHAQLIQELLEILDSQGIDLKQFDQNNDDVLDGLYLVWAGAHQGAGSAWWPYSDTFYFDFEVCGIQIGSFSSLSYELMNEDSRIRQYTAIHETGHQLGLTDYYVDSYTGGTGAAVMMDRNEGDEDCFSKMLLGWTHPQIITESCYVNLKSSSVTSDAAIIAPASWDGNYLSEYFMAEYVTPEANQNTQPLSTGAVRIWHVNAATSQWTDDITSSMYRYNNSGNGPKLLCIIDETQEWYDAGEQILEEQTLLYTGESSGISIRIEQINTESAMLFVSYYGEIPAKPETSDVLEEEESDSITEENTQSEDEASDETSDEAGDEYEQDVVEDSEAEGTLEQTGDEIHGQDTKWTPQDTSVVIPIVFVLILGFLVYLLLKDNKKSKHKRNKKRRR